MENLSIKFEVLKNWASQQKKLDSMESELFLSNIWGASTLANQPVHFRK